MHFIIDVREALRTLRKQPRFLAIASLTLAAATCPRRAEGFAFAGLMSVMNLADLASTTVGAWLYDDVFAGRLGPLIIVSAASTAFALVLVPLLRLDGGVSRRT